MIGTMVGDYVKVSEVKVLKTYKGDEYKWTLFTYQNRGYIGRTAETIMDDTTGNYKPAVEPMFDIFDDDASHLHLPEHEGIFELRCDDLEAELRVFRDLIR
jgi:hypothetical protein